MRRWGGALALILAGASVAGAGEFVLANGSRVAGELSNEVLMVSTGSTVIEIMPEEIQELTRQEVRLRDGRVVRGTLVGGRLKANTALGELAIRIEDLEVYRAADAVAAASPPAGSGAPGPEAGPSPPVTAPPPPSGSAGSRGTVSGTPKRVSPVDKLQDGFKTVGEAIWEGMKEVGRAVESVFSKP
jgi:hypothetical protein